MTWRTGTDVDEYLRAAGHLLADPVRQTVACTVVENRRVRDDGTVFAWWTAPDGVVRGAVSRTPPYPLLLVAVPEEAVAELVDLAVDVLDVRGLNGPQQSAALVAAVWKRRTGGRAELRFANRLYALERLADVPSPDGGAELVAPGETGDAVPLMQVFLDDAGVPSHDDAAALVRDRAETGGLLLWRDASGTAVSLAAHTRPAQGVVRVGPVVTAPDRRGRGYGGAATAAVTRKALDEGARGVVLFTDLANPTSNGLYQRLGFRAVEDRLQLDLRP